MTAFLPLFVAPPTSSPELGSAFAAPDWTSLGSMLAIVGVFLLANGILFRSPRTMVEERFGRKPIALRTIREFIFHRVQMTLGFAFLLGGFSLQLYGRLRPEPPTAFADAGSSLALWIGILVVGAVVLEVVGWWWSLVSMRRYVRAWLLENPPNFETDMALAREVGELFGIGSHDDDTVQTYGARLRKEVGLPPPSGAPRRRSDHHVVEVEAETVELG